jgi:hypothetical protein
LRSPRLHHLIHCGFVVVDGLHHALEKGIEELVRILGVAIHEQFHRALQIVEKHRNLFPP